MTLRSRTFQVTMKSLAEQKALGALIVRLMMALNDFDMAHYGNQRLGAARGAKRLGNWRTNAGRYFLRLGLSHLNEALNIIREIKNRPDLHGHVLSCDRQTKASYNRLVDFLDSDQWKKLNLIRNKVGFHYDRNEIEKALRRMESRRRRQLGKRKGKLKGVRKPSDLVTVTYARKHQERRYDPRELVENDIVLHGIFELRESDTSLEDEKLNEAAKTIQKTLHEMQNVFGDFAYNFVRRHARTT